MGSSSSSFKSSSLCLFLSFSGAVSELAAAMAALSSADIVGLRDSVACQGTNFGLLLSLQFSQRRRNCATVSSTGQKRFVPTLHTQIPKGKVAIPGTLGQRRIEESDRTLTYGLFLHKKQNLYTGRS
mmetsp:Transcript_4029/g.8257  ORF Transcript_4029/g.8257 Transcript_4029/m.8257 type:complete len:127 (+) Transcript_4029:103-483(+)